MYFWDRRDAVHSDVERRRQRLTTRRGSTQKELTNNEPSRKLKQFRHTTHNITCIRVHTKRKQMVCKRTHLFTKSINYIAPGLYSWQLYILVLLPHHITAVNSVGLCTCRWTHFGYNTGGWYSLHQLQELLPKDEQRCAYIRKQVQQIYLK